MKRWKTYLLVGMITMGFEAWSWFLGIGLAGWLAIVAASKYVGEALAEPGNRKRAQASREAADKLAARNAKLQSYQPSEFLPQERQGAIDRYSPQNRQPRQSNLAQYLRSFTQPR